MLSCGCDINSGSNKIISMDVDTKPKNIDPQLAVSDSELIIARNTLTGLFRISEDGKAEKSLCESVKVSDDRLTYYFKIKDAKWSDDRQITADDFVFGITRALSPITKSPYASSLFYIKNAEKFHNNEVGLTELGISATDSTTVKITLEKKIADIEYKLADLSAMPCNREFFTECKGKYGLSEVDMLYCGPFYVRSWSEKSIKLNRNNDYAGGEVKPASVTMTFGGTSDERIEDITDMKAADVRRLWQLFLVNYLGTEDPRAIGLFEKKVSVVGLMKMASTMAFSTRARLPGVMDNVLAIVRQNLLANAQQLIKLLGM